MEPNTNKSPFSFSDDEAKHLLLSKDAINTKKANEKGTQDIPYISEGKELWKCDFWKL